MIVVICLGREGTPCRAVSCCHKQVQNVEVGGVKKAVSRLSSAIIYPLSNTNELRTCHAPLAFLSFEMRERHGMKVVVRQAPHVLIIKVRSRPLSPIRIAHGSRDGTWLLLGGLELYLKPRTSLLLTEIGSCRVLVSSNIALPILQALGTRLEFSLIPRAGIPST